MSTLPIFPNLPGLDISVHRSELWSTLVQTACSGKELRASFWSTPRYQYELRFNFLRQAGFSNLTYQDEFIALQQFFDSMQGQYNAFLFTDPVDGQIKTVRFYEDNLDLEQFLFLVWKSQTIKMITVK